ncbi:MAG: alpha/beta fold hydrolase [Chthoniobacteraceae bacterium]
MPVIQSHFNPPFFLRNGHVQTILPVLLPRRFDIVYERERLELDDGDFLDMDWSRQGRGRLAVLLHGLEGCTDNGYIRGMAVALNAAGWDTVAWNFRGCGEELNRLPRFYHSGETGDLAAVIRHASAIYSSIALVGFSLGGNVVLKYLGEAPPHAAVVAGVAISTPVDLASSARSLDQRFTNRIYLRRFLNTLISKVEAKASRFPDHFDVGGIRRIGGFQEFDDRYTARLHGFRDADDYWKQSSSRQFIPGIGVPTLLVNAKNDPFLTSGSFPFDEAEKSKFFSFEAPASGGHVGFLDLVNGLQPWHETRTAQFLATVLKPVA